MTEQDVERIVKDKFQKGYGFDPLTIIAIISAAIQIYKFIKACRQSEALLKASAKRKGLAYRVFVRNNFLNKMKDLNLPDEVSEEIIEELRSEFIKD